MRRQFSLPEFDELHLDSLGLPWEAIASDGGQWVLIHSFPVAPGYNHTQASVAIRVETGYPDAALDMVYVHPALARCDGQAIGTLCPMVLDGKEYQRWSRHRTPENPWRPGEDSLETHLMLVKHWFEREFEKA